jgi:tetratricopeptide (TPR) repeat protein
LDHPGRDELVQPRVYFCPSTPKALQFLKFLVLFVLLQSAGGLRAQSDESYDDRRKRAFDLYTQNRFVDALPLLEKLHAERPTDIAVLEGLSFATLANAYTFTDPAARKAERAKARKLAEEAKTAGDNTNMLKTLLEVPDDGSETAFSSNAAVQSVMQEGEAAFARGDFAGAISAYNRALALDPNDYNAALFMGDVSFKQGDHAKAGEWFLRAIQIDPNRETAHRYWGDDLVAQGRMSEAKDKFINASVAQPYLRISWMGLSQWGQKQKLMLGHPPINPPGKVEDNGKDDKGHSQTTITIDPATMMNPNAKKDGTSAWFIYTLSKAVWHGERFQKEFPTEKEYRHSLAEEVDGFQMVVGQVKEGIKKKEIKQLDPALAMLVKLADEELLEPFVLVSRADQGIARDYPAYRDAHREKIRQYINEWLIHPAP